MRKLAILIVRRKWWVIVIALVALPVAAVVGDGVHARLSSGGFEDPSTESARARAELKRSFPQALRMLPSRKTARAPAAPPTKSARTNSGENSLGQDPV